MKKCNCKKKIVKIMLSSCNVDNMKVLQKDKGIEFHIIGHSNIDNNVLDFIYNSEVVIKDTKMK